MRLLIDSPAAPTPSGFLLEMRSERFVDLLHALHEAGFDVSASRSDRYVIEDHAKEPARHGA
jgi:hypothetical protein